MKSDDEWGDPEFADEFLDAFEGPPVRELRTVVISTTKKKKKAAQLGLFGEAEAPKVKTVLAWSTDPWCLQVAKAAARVPGRCARIDDEGAIVTDELSALAMYACAPGAGSGRAQRDGFLMAHARCLRKLSGAARSDLRSLLYEEAAYDEKY